MPESIVIDRYPTFLKRAYRLATSILVAMATISSPLLPRDASAEESGERFPVLPLSLVIAETDGHPVVTRVFEEISVAWASAIFGVHGIRFEIIERRTLEAAHARLETRDDRHALGAKMHPKVINCFVVKSLRDVDDPSRYRQGVHWRPRGYHGKHFIILSSMAGPTVLAHELGHFFGNRPHSKVPGNLMSYSRGRPPPFFDEKQVRIVKRWTRKFLKTGELVPRTERSIDLRF